MVRHVVFASLVTLCGISVSGCSSTWGSAAAGGAAGAAVGAGAGTAIGAATGNMGAGAIAGAGIGIPIGIAAGVLYHDHEQERQVAERDQMIQANREQIIRTQEALDEQRNDAERDSQAMEPDRSQGRYQFNGARLGSSY